MKYRYIALLDSHYTLFMYYLLFPRQVDNTLFIVSNGISAEVRERLKNCLYLPDKKYKNLKKIREIIRNISVMLCPSLIKLRCEKDIQYYGQDHAWFSFIGRNKPFVLLEDGIDNYVKKPSMGLKRKMFSYLGISYKEFGRGANVMEIKLSGLSSIPQDIAEKVSLVDIQKQWQCLGGQEKENIISLFIRGNKVSAIEKEVSVLLITQPLNQDGLMTEKEKLELYLSALKGINGDILVKRHPRDDTDYSRYNLETICFDDAPLQLLTLLGLHFDVAVTYNSSSIYSLSKDVKEKIIIDNAMISE